MSSRVKPRWIVLSVLAVVFATVVVAAGIRIIHSMQKPESTPSADTLAAEMVQEMGYKNSYIQIAADSVQKYYPMDSSLLESKGMWIDKRSSIAGELCCFRLRRSDDAEQAEKVIHERLNQKARALHGLSSGQDQLVKNAAVVQSGTYLLVAVSDNTEAETRLFKKLLN